MRVCERLLCNLGFIVLLCVRELTARALSVWSTIVHTPNHACVRFSCRPQVVLADTAREAADPDAEEGAPIPGICTMCKKPAVLCEDDGEEGVVRVPLDTYSNLCPPGT